MKTALVIVKLKHDKGTHTVKVWATGIEAAKQHVLQAENAPYFFDRKTMCFWGQKMSDFSIYRHGDDKFLIEAPRPHGVTRRIYNPFAGTVRVLPKAGI